MSRLAETLDRPEPTMAVVLQGALEPHALEDVARVSDVIEFRADLSPMCEHDYLEAQVKRLARLPVVLTVRMQSEGGRWRGTDRQRLSLISNLLPHVDGVDIELASGILPEVSEMAGQQDEEKVVIASSHDFSRTPSFGELEDQLERTWGLNVDYVKFATMTDSLEDFQELVKFTSSHRDDRLIVVGMGEYGPASRIILPMLGSHLTYAFSGEDQVAPGQMDYLETHRRLKEASPAYAGLFTD